MSAIRFRGLSMDDVPFIAVWYNNRHLVEQMSLDYFKPMPEALYEETITQWVTDDRRVVWMIEYEGGPAGLLMIKHIDHRNQSCSLGCLVAPDIWGYGIGPKALQYGLAFGFDELNMNRVHFETSAENTRIQRIADRLGFLLEGVRRQAFFRNGKFLDILEYAILRAEYRLGR